MMKTKRRGQISIEYLVVLGFATFAITAIVAVVFLYSSGINDQVKFNHIENFGNAIIENAESVYFAGSPSKVTISPYLPEGIKEIDIEEDQLFIEVYTSSGITTLSFKSDAPLVDKPDLSAIEGIKNVLIKFNNANEIDISW